MSHLLIRIKAATNLSLLTESTNGLASLRLKYRFEKLADVTSLNTQTGDRFSIEPLPTEPLSQPSRKPAQHNNQFQDDNIVCGTPVAGFTQSLVIGGQAAGRGEW